MTDPHAGAGELGVTGRERARAGALTVPEAEAEAFASACRLADARGCSRPDREAHRAAFYARHGYRPDDPAQED